MMYTGDMLLSAFDAELQKLAAYDADKERRRMERELRKVTKRETKRRPMLFGEGAPRQRDYMASAALAALAFPAVSVMQAGLGRGVRNRAVIKAMQTAGRRQRRKLSKRLEAGPLVAKSHLAKGKSPLSREDLTTRALTGGIFGSAIQAMRDRFASSPV